MNVVSCGASSEVESRFILQSWRQSNSMGDNFLKRQAQNFKKGRELATGEMNQPTLFSRPEIITTTYSAVPVEQCQLQTGEVLTAFASEDGNQVTLARGHR